MAITDNGRGIPVEMHPEMKISALEVVMTTLHAGGKFDHESYKVSGGLHGVGVSVVNALSEWCSVEVSRGGDVYRQDYKIGVAQGKVKKIGKCKTTGTKVSFYPDFTVFKKSEYKFDIIASRLRELAFLNQGLTIILKDHRSDKEVTFSYKGGLASFVEYLNENKNPVYKKPIHFKKTEDDVDVEVAIQYNDSYSESVYSYVNNINTIEGGTHLSGFRAALTRSINNYAKKNSTFKKKNITLVGDDAREGLTAVISVKVRDPQFEGQTKTKLGNSEIKGFVDSIVTSSLSEFFEENPSTAKKIISKSLDAAKARLAAKKAKDLVRRKNAFSLGEIGRAHV